MGTMTFNLPDPGEGLLEAEIVSWKVAEGDTVSVNDVVVEIETAKSLVELPIPWAGTVAGILVPEGQVVEVGTPLIRIETAGEVDHQTAAAPGADVPAEASAAPGSAEMADSETAGAPEVAVAGEMAGSVEDGAPKTASEERVANLVGYGAVAGASSRRRRSAESTSAVTDTVLHAATPEQDAATSQQDAVAAMQRAGGPARARVRAKPPVRKYAKDRGVDLGAVTGSGPRGTITRADVDAYLTGRHATERPIARGATADAEALAAEPSRPAGPDPGGREVRVPVKGVRKVTAQAMVASAFSAPTVTEFVRVDITPTVELIERLRDEAEYRDVRLTELVFVAKAVLLACRRNPGVNATWDEAAQEIVLKNYVNLGIAAATPRGLVVPNIKDAHRLTVRELAVALTSLVTTAREGRTQPADQAGGTITITNIGVFGIDAGTPILNPGESAILCFGAVRRMPWVVTGPDGEEAIVPRWVIELALSFDHRLVDGDLGSRFLSDVAAVLADPAKGLLWG